MFVLWILEGQVYLERRENRRRCATWKLKTGLMISLSVSDWLR